MDSRLRGKDEREVALICADYGGSMKVIRKPTGTLGQKLPLSGRNATKLTKYTLNEGRERRNLGNLRRIGSA